MNWRHLRAFVWLRWRLLHNHWRRGGTLNAVLMMTAIALFDRESILTRWK